MEERYARNIPALTEAECGILRRRRVLIVGCGGLGGHLAELLSRLGIGAIRVVDGDVFEPSNLNRQLLSEVSLLGSGKAQAGIHCVYGAISGWVAQAAVSMPGDHLMEILYPEGTVLRDKSVLSFTPALCVKLLTGRSVDTGTVYHFDLLNQEFETIPLG